MAVGVSPPTFLHSFPPLGYACELFSSLVIQRKLLHDIGDTKLQRPWGAPTHGIPIVVTHTVTHPQSSTSWTHEANMLSLGQTQTNSLNISRSRPPESPLEVAFGIKVEVGGGKGGAIRGTKLARSRHLFTWL